MLSDTAPEAAQVQIELLRKATVAEMPAPDVVRAVSPVIAALERLRVPYYLGGSVASSAYGIARSTLDADLVADLSQEHAVPLADALRSDYGVLSVQGNLLDRDYLNHWAAELGLSDLLERVWREVGLQGSS